MNVQRFVKMNMPMRMGMMRYRKCCIMQFCDARM